MATTTAFSPDDVMRVSLFNLPLDINVSHADISRAIEHGTCLISYLNPYGYKVARTHTSYHSALSRCDLVVCDSIGIRIAANTIFKSPTEVLAVDFSGIAQIFLQRASDLNFSMCMVGGSPETADKSSKKIVRDFPGFKKIDSFDGYGKSPDKARDFILSTSPQMVLVGMGMGRQEYFLMDLVDSGWSGVGICVGGFLDKVANPQLEYPPWALKYNLKFLSRLMSEPRRLSRRYFIDYQPFINCYFKYLIFRK